MLLNGGAAVAPTVTGIGPSAGPVTGGQSVTITGTDLTGATGVTIGGTAATLICTTHPLVAFDLRGLAVLAALFVGTGMVALRGRSLV